jgi:hypothetical protein
MSSKHECKIKMRWSLLYYTLKFRVAFIHKVVVFTFVIIMKKFNSIWFQYSNQMNLNDSIIKIWDLFIFHIHELIMKIV